MHRRTWSCANITCYDNFVGDAVEALRLSPSLRKPSNLIGTAYLTNSSSLASGHRLLHSPSTSGQAGLNTVNEKNEIKRTSTEYASSQHNLYDIYLLLCVQC